MSKQNKQIEYLKYQKEREEYIPENNSKNDPIFKKLKHGKVFLFFAPLIHVGACVVFLVLLLIGLIFQNKLGFTLTSTQTALAFSYIAFSILVDILLFILPAKKVNKKSHFRIVGISTLIFSTLILSGSLIFFMIPSLLFYSIVSLIIWVFEVIAAIYLILVVEALPN